MGSPPTPRTAWPHAVFWPQRWHSPGRDGWRPWDSGLVWHLLSASGGSRGPQSGPGRAQRGPWEGAAIPSHKRSLATGRRRWCREPSVGPGPRPRHLTRPPPLDAACPARGVPRGDGGGRGLSALGASLEDWLQRAKGQSGQGGLPATARAILPLGPLQIPPRAWHFHVPPENSILMLLLEMRWKMSVGLCRKALGARPCRGRAGGWLSPSQAAGDGVGSSGAPHLSRNP